MVLYRSYLGGCPFRAVCYAADDMEGVFNSECITYVMECMLHAGHSALYSYCRWVIMSHSPLHIYICCTFYKLSTVRLFHGFVFFSSFILNHFWIVTIVSDTSTNVLLCATSGFMCFLRCIKQKSLPFTLCPPSLVYHNVWLVSSLRGLFEDVLKWL